MVFPLRKPFFEIEARIGVIKSPYGHKDMRVLSSGPKRIATRTGSNAVVNAFIANDTSQPMGTHFQGGITRSDFTHWTGGGLSEPSPISLAFGVKVPSSGGGVSPAAAIKKELAEVESVETVYGGYADNNRVCFPGDHSGHSRESRGKLEKKERVYLMDLAVPSAKYDLRVQIATEEAVEEGLREVPAGYRSKRLKRRRSYTRKDCKFAWRLDVTEVSVENVSPSDNDDEENQMSYEVEMELDAKKTLELLNSEDGKVGKFCGMLSQQLWWMLKQINPLSDVLEVDNYIREHPNHRDVKLALAQLVALRTFMNEKEWDPAINKSYDSLRLPNKLYFIGCMPVNFSRHNIEQVQRATDGYYLSEKTDGVRYLLVFLGNTAVLVDRAMKGNQPVPQIESEDPFASVLDLIQPGTVMDGEVVIHRKFRRPIFIVFDVLCCGNEPVLHKSFEERLSHLRSATFRTRDANRDMFASSNVKNQHITLPLVRKNFVRRTELDKLLGYVVEEQGTRCYRNGECHYHLTDGIIFQPNRPYQIGTDTHLLKWKYLDTVTIDVELLPPKMNYRTNKEETFRVGVVGDDGSMVDMTRFVHLPTSEKLRLEADKFETGAKIAEIGFDPETGEWYYMTMRPDKIASNHISTVMGTLLELAECLGTDELRYRMNVRGGRDTYRKDVRGMQKQLLEHQRRVLGRKDG